MQDGSHALEAHAGIDVLRWQGSQAAIGSAIELDEDEVPDLDDLRGPFIDQGAAALVRRVVVVNLGARSARPGLAHFPEIVLLVAEVNVTRVDVGFASPELGRLVVPLQPLLGIALENRGMKARLVQAPFLGEQLPGPANGFLLEVISK